MPDNEGVSIPVNSTANLAGFDAAAKASVDLGARLRELEGAEGQASQPVAPKVSLPGADDAEHTLSELSEGAKEFIDTLKLGVGINIGEKLVEGIGEVYSALKEAISEGVEFNAEVQSSVNSFASTLQSVEPQIFATRDAAKASAADVFGSVRDYAIQNGLDVKTTFEALSANFNAFIEAGVTDTSKQIQFVSTILAAEASKGIDGQRALRDSIDLLQGRFNNLVFAKEIGVTADEFKRAAENGQQVDYILQHLTGYAAGISDQAQSFRGLATSVEELEKQLAGSTFAPVFNELEIALRDLKTELQDPAVAAGLKEIGFEVADVVHTGATLLNFCIQNAGALTSLAEAGTLAGVALGAVSVKNLVLGLGEYLFATQAATAATTEETAAVVVNAEANEAAAVSGSRFGAAVGGVVTPINAALVAGIALNALIVKLAADLDISTQKAAAAGKSFDSARGTNADFLGDAQTTAGYEKRRKALQDEIDAEKKIIADGTTQDFVPDGAGGGVTFDVMSDAAQGASERVAELENRMKELDAVRRGSLDTTNLDVTTQVEGSKKVSAALDDEASAGTETAKQISKARGDIIQVTKEQADAQKDLATINAYLASDEGKRLASTKEGQEQIAKLQADAKKDLDDIATAEQKLADLRANAYPKETAEIAALNEQLKQMATDGTEATADARAAIQNQIRDLTNTTQGKAAPKSLDDLDRESIDRANTPDPGQADQDFQRQGVTTQGALPGVVNAPGTGGSINEFTRRPDLSQPDADNGATADLGTAADNTGTASGKLGDAASKLGDASSTLASNSSDLGAQATQVVTGLQTVGQKQDDYHNALITGLQANADANGANMDALTKVLTDQARIIQQQGASISTLQLIVDNLGNDDS